MIRTLAFSLSGWECTHIGNAYFIHIMVPMELFMTKKKHSCTIKNLFTRQYCEHCHMVLLSLSLLITMVTHLLGQNNFCN